VVKWLTLLLRIQWIQDSNIGLETGCMTEDFCVFR